jgi:hypothetical protein
MTVNHPGQISGLHVTPRLRSDYGTWSEKTVHLKQPAETVHPVAADKGVGS